MTSASDRAKEWLSLTQMGWEDSDDLETLTTVIGKAQADALRAAGERIDREFPEQCDCDAIVAWLQRRAAEIENGDAQLPK